MHVDPASGRAAAALVIVLGLLPATGASAREPVSVEEAASELRAPAAELEPADRETSRGTSFLRLRQEVEGVPVLGAEAVVSEDERAAGDLVADDTRRDVSSPPEPQLGRADALARARQSTDAGRLRAPASAELAIRPDAGGGTLVWRVLLPVEDPVADLEVLIDARSGAVVSTRNLIQRATGQGRVFDPNAVVAQGSYEGLADNNDADSGTLTSLLTDVTLPRLAPPDMPYGELCLAGDWAHARLPADAAGSGEVCAPAGDFDELTREDDEFEAVMSYFHVDRAQAYIQSLGFMNVNDRRTPITANALEEDNSKYSHVTRSILLGSGGVDDGEDGDVIVHEYGHAVQENQVPSFGIRGDTPAMGEGFADYFAAVMSSEGPAGQSHSQFDPCMFEWDTWGSESPAPCLRRVDTGLRIADLAHKSPCGPHCIGQVWSGALWYLRDQLGEDGLDRSIMDVLALQSHFYLTSSATFDDGARAILAADQALYGGAHKSTLRAVLTQRGLLDPNIERTLSIRYSNGSDGFKGALGARLPACAADQRVTIHKKVKGPDRQIGQDRTDASGRYLEKERRRDGRFYAKAPSSTANGDKCLDARSVTTELD